MRNWIILFFIIFPINLCIYYRYINNSSLNHHHRNSSIMIESGSAGNYKKVFVLYGIFSTLWIMAFLFIRLFPGIEEHKTQSNKILKSFAHLKNERLSDWVNEEMSEIKTFLTSDRTKQLLLSFQNENADTVKNLLLKRLQRAGADMTADNVFLTDIKGNILLGTDNKSKNKYQSIIKNLINHYSGSGTHPEISIADDSSYIVSFIAPCEINGRQFGYVIPMADVKNAIGNLLGSLAGEYNSDESFLLKYEDNHPLILSPLKFTDNSKTTNSEYASQLTKYNSFAKHNEKYAYVGKDYRGIDCLYNFDNIKNTNWILVNKIDLSEINGSFYSNLIYEGSSTLAFLIIIGGMLVLYKATRQKQIYKTLYLESVAASIEHQELKNILTNMEDAVITFDMNGIVRTFNNSAEQLLRKGVSEFEAGNINDLINLVSLTNDNFSFRLCFENVLSSQKTFVFADNYALHNSDGSLALVSGSISVLKGDDNNLSGILIILSDKTEAERMKLTLEKSRNRFQNLYDSMSEGFADFEIIYDSLGNVHDYKIIDVNDKFEVLFNVQKENIAGVPISRLANYFLPSDIEEIIEVSETGIPKNYELYIPQVEKHLSLNVFSSTKGRFAITFQDITEKKLAQEALIENQAKFKCISEQIGSLIFIVELTGQITYLSKSIERIFGYREVEVIGANFFELVHKTKRQEAVQLFHKSNIEKQGIKNYALKMVHKDGTSFYGSINSEYFDYTNSSGVIGVLTDITEKKKVEDLTNARLHLMRFAADHNLEELFIETLDYVCDITDSKIGFYHTLEEDQKTLCLQAWSTATTKYFCTAAGKGQHYNLDMAGVWADCVRERKAIIHNDYKNLETKKGLPPGHAEVHRQLVVPIFRGQNIVAILGVGNKEENYRTEDISLVAEFAELAWNIAEKKMITQKIIESESNFKRSESIANIGHWRLDLNNKVFHASDGSKRIYGFDKDFDGGMEHVMMVPLEEYRGYMDKAITDLVKHGKPYDLEFKIKRVSDGLIRDIHSLAEYDIENNTLFGIIHDITEEKAAQGEVILAKIKAEEMNKAKSSFFANMSHELRTPLIGILGFSELLSDQISDNTHLSGMADTIHSSGIRLLETLNLILTFSKLESDKIIPNNKIENIVPVIEDVVNVFSKTAELKGLKLMSNYSHSEITLNIDSGLLNSILNNLVNNAVKFTEEGIVEVKTTVLGNEIKIEVIDTGCGIPAEKADVIWHEFRQASEGLGRSFEGTGLGLSISKRFTEILGGTLLMESIVGKGSTFIVSLPFNKAIDGFINKPVEESTPVIIAESVNAGEIPHILYVEDDFVSQQYVNMVVSDSFKLTIAVNSKQALSAVKLKKYDCILMDINLGREMDGITLTKLIREFPGYAEVPVIALTAFAMESDKTEFLKEGLDYYISKPFKPNELMNLLKKILA